VANGEISQKPIVNGDGDAAVVVEEESIREAIKQTKDGLITIRAGLPVEAAAVIVHIPVRPLLAAGSGMPEHIRIDTGVAALSVRTDMLRAYGEASVMQVRVERADTSGLPRETFRKLGHTDLYAFGLLIDGQPAGELKNKNDITASIGFALKPGQKPGRVAVYAVGTDGAVQIIKSSRYDSKLKAAVFELPYMGAFAAAYQQAVFTDLGPAGWAEEAIEELAARGVLDGIGGDRYAPDGAVTRAEFISMLLRVFDRVEPDAVGTLSDLDEDAWYYRAAATAQQLGIVEGRENNTFGADDPISRQDMAVIAQRFMKQAGLPTGAGQIRRHSRMRRILRLMRQIR